MINGKKVLAITLARGGSKKIKKKNITKINGKPLLLYTVEQVAKSKYIDNYIVSTDDLEIADICIKFDVPYFWRSEENATDRSKSSDALIEVVKEIGGDYDYIAEIMCTNPLKIVEDIDGCIEKIENTNADSVVAVNRIWDNHPSRVKYIEDDLLKDFYPETPESRRQDLSPPAYIRSGSVYITTRVNLLKYKIRLSGVIRPYEMPEDRVINIDDTMDLKFAEFIMNKRGMK